MNQVIDRAAVALEPLRESGKNMSVERAITLKRAMPEQVRALEPLLRARGLEWNNVRTLPQPPAEFLWSRLALRPTGTQRIPICSTALECSTTASRDKATSSRWKMPGTGRSSSCAARLYSAFGSENIQCDWQSIVDLAEGLMLDLPILSSKRRGPGSAGPTRKLTTSKTFTSSPTFLDSEADHGEAGIRILPYERRRRGRSNFDGDLPAQRRYFWAC